MWITNLFNRTRGLSSDKFEIKLLKITTKPVLEPLSYITPLIVMMRQEQQIFHDLTMIQSDLLALNGSGNRGKVHFIFAFFIVLFHHLLYVNLVEEVHMGMLVIGIY